MSDPQPALDLPEHIARLEAASLLHRIDVPVDKDAQMHPLVRWQFRGGLKEAERRAFLFTNVIDGQGRRFDGMRVAVGAFAANPEIYRIGMGVPTLDDIGPAWDRALANPVKPRLVEVSPVHDVVITGHALRSAGGELQRLPIPISTPGFDAAPYLTATCVVTRDPDTGIQNIGTYRGQLKGPDRLGMMMLAAMRAGGHGHWLKHRARGEPMPIAIILGCAPIVGYMGPQKLPLDVDEIDIAGGLAGKPIDVVRCRTVNLTVPAHCELVIEGFVDPTYLEPEGPFGESHGYVALEDYNMIVDVTAITHRAAPIVSSIISQVTPSESSVVKRLAYEPMFLRHLRDGLSIRGLKRVVMHEPLTNLRRFLFLQFERGTSRSEIWRALHGAITLQAPVGKWVIAVDDDIDPLNADAVFWAMSYRCDPARDTQVVADREPGHGPRSASHGTLDSAMLIDATMKAPMPPLALPKRAFMEDARRLWESLGLPPLRPESPWFGYSLGDWAPEWDEQAMRAAAGGWASQDESYRQRRRRNVAPNTPVRGVPPDSD